MKTNKWKFALMMGVALVVGPVQAYPPAPATQAQVDAGVQNYLYVTPATLRGALGPSAAAYDGNGMTLSAAARADADGALREVASYGVYTNLVLATALTSRFPFVGGDLLGNAVTLYGPTNTDVDGLVCMGTNGLTVDVGTLTNYTLVWIAPALASAYDTNGSPAVTYAMNFLWSMADTNTDNGWYFGADIRDSQHEYFLRGCSNKVWSASSNPTLTTEVPFKPCSTGLGNGAYPIDVFQRGSVYALTCSNGTARFYWNGALMNWGASAQAGTSNFTPAVTHSGPVNRLTLGKAPANYLTNSWHGNPNTNWYGGRIGVVMLFNSTTIPTVRAGYAAACWLDGRDRTYLYGFSIIDEMYNPVNFGLPYDVFCSHRINELWADAYPNSVFQNYAHAGGLLANQCAANVAYQWTVCNVTNTPKRIKQRVITEGVRNDVLVTNLGPAATYYTNFINFYKPASDYGADVILLRLSNPGTNTTDGMALCTNATVGYDYVATNCLFLKKYVNAAPYVGSQVIKTNSVAGNYTLSQDNIHWFGSQHTNWFSAVINLIEAGAWTGYGATSSPAIY